MDWIASHPWLMTQDALEQVIAIAERTNDVQAFQALQSQDGKRMDNSRAVEMRGDVAIIPITGPIFRYANLFTQISGGTSTDMLAKDLAAAINNPAVKRIVLDINSPGGEATGINEMGDMIRDARGRKQIDAYIGGIGASAAYWLASPATNVYADRTALIGSIGVVMQYKDTKARDEREGTRMLEFVSSASPNKRLDPADEEGAASVQAIVDALGEIFVSVVARNRGTTVTNVKQNYGKGGVMLAEQALRVGMIDGLSSLEKVIAGTAHASPAARSSNSQASVSAETGAMLAQLDAALEAQASGKPAVSWERAALESESLTPDVRAALSAAEQWDAALKKTLEAGDSMLSPEAKARAEAKRAGKTLSSSEIYAARRSDAKPVGELADADTVYGRRKHEAGSGASGLDAAGYRMPNSGRM